MDTVDLLHPDKMVPPGIGDTLLLAEIAHITAFGAFKTPAVPPVFGDELIITGDHTFAPGKGFVRWQFVDETGQLKAPITGAKGSLGLKPELTIFIPGLTPAYALAAVQNKRYIGLVKAMGCNSTQQLQLGDDCNPLMLVPSDGFTSGTAGGNDPRGWAFKLSTNYAMYFYEGDIQMYGEEEEGGGD